MNTQRIEPEPLYSYAEWERIYKRRTARKRKRHNERALKLLKQKVMGLVLILIAGITFFISSDITVTLLLLPIGFYILTRQNIFIIGRKGIV